jgi:protein-tyrosine phosphatase
MIKAILITECLQNDFVKPIAPGDLLPNLLHVGAEESRRLMGENPAEGPVARVMAWAYSRPKDDLAVIHLRDRHDPADPDDAAHLKHFGGHCLAGTPGAEFAFKEPSDSVGRAEIVDTPGLNDFMGTRLADLLSPLAGEPIPVGLMGVWTEAKVTFLAYELATRFPRFKLGICSALTAGSSRARHFLALDQLERILGVRIFESVGGFIRFLGGEEPSFDERAFTGKHPEIFLDESARLEEADRLLLRQLFRDCRSMSGRALGGGFSGAVVLLTQSVDLHGHEQASHVVKIGPRDPIGRERTAFERIEPVLGNNAPRIADFADLADRGAIKYRYASMGGRGSTTFQKLYMAGLPQEQVEDVLRTVFREQLGRLYRAGVRESRNLFEYYQFSRELAPGLRERVMKLTGGSADRETIDFPGDRSVRHPALFYETALPDPPELRRDAAYFSFVHGDLNGANIVIDSPGNVWLIDFFHTHYGHVLRDLIKLENDLLYIFTPIEGESDFEEALALTDLLAGVRDLAVRPAPVEFRSPHLTRAYATVRFLRSLYPELIHEASDPLQFFAGQLRYAGHTLSFDEPNTMQKRWALYTAGLAAERLRDILWHNKPLRVDWLDEECAAPGRIGVTLLPGRRDIGRDPARDLERIGELGVTHVVSLVVEAELSYYGVEGLFDGYRARGLDVLHIPAPDREPPTREEMDRIAAFVDEAVSRGGRVMIHCVGGLGRSGTAAAAYLKTKGWDTEAAVREVRRARSPRAIETTRQMDFIKNYRKHG